MKFACLALTVVVAFSPNSRAQSGINPASSFESKIKVLAPKNTRNLEGDMESYDLDLRKTSDLKKLKVLTSKLLELAKLQNDFEEKNPDRVLPFENDLASSGKRRALEEALGLIDQLLAKTKAPNRSALMNQLLETSLAVQNSLRYPLKKSYQLFPEILPVLLVTSFQHPKIRENMSEAGLLKDPKASDLSRVNPINSTFWTDSGDLKSKDLYTGFGRAGIPDYSGVCEYVKPKTGWGAHPGFHLKCGEAELRFKMGDEIYGGPFNSRIWNALGYNTFAIDKMPALKIKYSRRLFTEFNSRKILKYSAKLAIINLYTKHVTEFNDPFEYIQSAVLKDGSTISVKDLEARLLKSRHTPNKDTRPETLATNFDENFESTIDYVVMQPGAIAEEPKNVKQIGAWDYDQLDHQNRREIRAMTVLAAWVDQYNLRWENTRLSYVKDGSNYQLKHYFSDVGSGIGISENLLKMENSDAELMPWTVTERDGDTIKFKGFNHVQNNKAFKSMTLNDALWMLRRISAFSEEQVLSALLGTGMSAAEVRLALEKLLSKRQKMVADFGLNGEFPEIASRKIDTRLDFDPKNPQDLASVTLRRADGSTVVPPAGKFIVRNGHLVETK